MERVYTYKFRLYPNIEQQVYLANVFECCRLVYNYFLNEKKKQYNESKTSDSYNVQQSKLTKLRKSEGFEFLNAVSLQSLQYSLRNMHTAYDNFYKHRSSYPKFKNRRDKQSFKIAQPNTFHIKDNKLYIPKLKSGIDIVVSKEITGKVCFATISRSKSDRYYVSITVKQNYTPSSKIYERVGLDLGIKELIITSKGFKYASKRGIIRYYKRKLKKCQRCLARKAYGSKKYENQVLKCNRIHQKITDIKTDYIHKITTELVRQFDLIKVEDLDIKGMMKNHKLAESISECNWHQFVQTLEYKCRWNDKTMMKVDRYYPSSQMCSECGYINKKSKIWLCVSGLALTAVFNMTETLTQQKTTNVTNWMNGRDIFRQGMPSTVVELYANRLQDPIKLVNKRTATKRLLNLKSYKTKRDNSETNDYERERHQHIKRNRV